MLHAATLVLVPLVVFQDDPLGREELLLLEERIVAAGEDALRATVGLQIGNGRASGVLVTPDGYVATVGHNIDRPFQRCTVLLADGREVEAVTLGKWGSADCGLVRITEEGEYPFAPLGTSADLREHQPVIATGHPSGPSSDTPASLRFGSVERNGDDWVRTTCVIMPGDSGGGLFDLDGRLVGICSRIQVELRVNDSVPVDHLVEAWDRLASGEAFDLEERRRSRRRREASEPDPGLLAFAKDPPPAPPVGGAGGESSGDSPAASEPLPSTSRQALRDATALLVEEARRSVVRLEGERDGEPSVILGAVVAAGGLVLTKASELGDDLAAHLSDGREVAAQVLASDASLDLALVRVAEELTPLTFAEDVELTTGLLLVSVGLQEQPLQVGVVSRPVDRVPSLSPGFLGVQIEDAEGGGARVVRIVPDTAAERAGVLVGDVLRALDGEAIADRVALIRGVQAREPGQRVRLDVLRGEEALEIEAELGAPPPRESGEDSRRHQHAADRAEVSGRRDRFPAAVRNDSALSPWECGGPVLDLSGRVVGLNAARADRTASYLLPASEVLRVLAALKERAGIAGQPSTEARTLAGWTVHVDRALLEGEHAGLGVRALEQLESHLRQVAVLVPRDRLERLRAVAIQVDRDDPNLSGMQYHPSLDWLVGHGHSPDLEKRVHIPEARALVSRDLMAVQPRVILHELAHAFHDQVLGFDDGRVREAYRAAVDGGAYEEVLHVDGRTVRHYALENHKEYFAEGTEAYFGANDFYPFVRAELERHDAGLFALLEEVWGELP